MAGADGAWISDEDLYGDDGLNMDIYGGAFAAPSHHSQTPGHPQIVIHRLCGAALVRVSCCERTCVGHEFSSSEEVIASSPLDVAALPASPTRPFSFSTCVTSAEKACLPSVSFPGVTVWLEVPPTLQRLQPCSHCFLAAPFHECDLLLWADPELAPAKYKPELPPEVAITMDSIYVSDEIATQPW